MINPEKSPCWIITHPTGQPYDEDGYGWSHYSTEWGGLDALQEIRDRRKEEERTPSPADLAVTRQAGHCLTLQCDGCECPAEDDEGTFHYATRGEAEAVFGPRAMNDWTTDGTRHHCGDCPPLVDRSGPILGQETLVLGVTA